MIADWMETYTGKKIYVDNPNPEDICIEDIAHALSLQCRFNGHCRQFYSIAEHSVLVSQYCYSYKLEGLLHDAAEAYIGDMVRPIKFLFPLFNEIERKILEAIDKKFDCSISHPKPFGRIVDEVDRRILTNEAHALFDDVSDWCISSNPLPDIVINCWSPQVAEKEFLKQFEEVSRSEEKS